MIQPTGRRFPWAALAACCLLVNGGCLHNLPWTGNETPSAENAAPVSSDKVLAPAQSAQLHLNLGDKMEKSGHDAEAIACFEKARQCDAHVQVARRLAALYDRVGDNKHALEEYQKAVKTNPRDADLLNDFGYYHYTRGQWPEAEQKFRAALAVNPNSARAWINLGLTLGALGDYDKSLAAFMKTVSEAEGLSNLGFIKTTQGKVEEAKQSYRDALRLDPTLRIAQVALQKLDNPSPRPAAPMSEASRSDAVAIPAVAASSLR